MACPTYIGSLPSLATRVLWNADRTVLYAQDGNTITRYDYPALTFIDTFSITGGAPIALDDQENVYFHSGFNLRKRDPAGTVTTIGSTVSTGGGLSLGTVWSPYDGLLYKLGSQTPGQVRSYSTTGISSQPGTLVATLPGVYDDVSGLDTLWAGGSVIWFAAWEGSLGDTIGEAVSYDIATSTLTVHPQTWPLGVLPDSRAFVEDGGVRVRLSKTGAVAPLGCPAFEGFLIGGDPILIEKAMFSAHAVMLWIDGTDYRIYEWDAPAQWRIGRIGWPT